MAVAPAPVGYTRGVRALLAAVIAALLIVATTADRLDCQDGCTEQTQRGSATTTSSACGLCHGWSAAVATVAAPPQSQPTLWLAADSAHEQAPHLDPVDRPPRIA